jgi:hypothetical protein
MMVPSRSSFRRARSKIKLLHERPDLTQDEWRWGFSNKTRDQKVTNGAMQSIAGVLFCVERVRGVNFY